MGVQHVLLPEGRAVPQSVGTEKHGVPWMFGVFFPPLAHTSHLQRTHDFRLQILFG